VDKVVSVVRESVKLPPADQEESQLKSKKGASHEEDRTEAAALPERVPPRAGGEAHGDNGEVYAARLSGRLGQRGGRYAQFEAGRISERHLKALEAAEILALAEERGELLPRGEFDTRNDALLDGDNRRLAGGGENKNAGRDFPTRH